ncbi:type IV pilus secretin PilQ [Pseudohongiella acticola]|jgi:type IV pilus assembly protein PilQ|uniref:type IV pilus secretin PilQ n=1 Tax=Pseudohongiella acticola TaxID=1524254 RepID=UPI0030EBD106
MNRRCAGRLMSLSLVSGICLLMPVLSLAAEMPVAANVRVDNQASAQQKRTSAEATPISVEFDDLELRTALQILAQELGYELLLDDAVKGTTSFRIADADPQQALKAMLQGRNLDMRLRANLLHVAPPAVLLALDNEARRLREATATMQTEYLQINYASVEIMLALVTGEGDSAGGLLSERGSASMDARTNTLIVRDTETRLLEVKALLRELDVPVRQVLIETRIVSASTEIGRQLGARWGAFSHTGATAPSGAIASDDPVSEFVEGVTVLADHRQASTIAAGVLRRRLMLELELSALENSGQAELIARPRVTTQDNVPASIRSGVRIPYQAQAGGTAGGSITEFVDAVLSLDVTPLITPDGRIIMKLGIRQDSVASGSGDVPAINTNTVTTQVLVDNGDTLVLGGIFRDEQTREEVRTPLLGDVPVLGWLFRRSQQAARRTELLIFITPQIVSP